MCDDWCALHIACFNKTHFIIKLLVEYGANVNLIGDWGYTPINFLFVEYARREKYIIPAYDEWLQHRWVYKQNITELVTELVTESVTESVRPFVHQKGSLLRCFLSTTNFEA